MLVILTDNSGMAKIKLIDESGTISKRFDAILIHLTSFRK